MAFGSVGWICPKCGVIISPYETSCAKCAAKPTITMVSGTVFFTPQLEEAQRALDKSNRKLNRYNEWADKIVDFYGRLTELTEELDDLTDEPDEIEND